MRGRQARPAQFGQQPGQLPYWPAWQQPGYPVCPEFPHQGAQQRRERAERQAVGPQLQAVTGQDPRAGTPGRVGELADQPGLAHPGLAADEHSGRATLPDRRQGGCEGGHLLAAPDEDWARPAPAHVLVKDARGN
jgi:hypothetical protein